jgi:dihydrofolate reductase
MGKVTLREATMSRVFTGASMSLDGYISGPSDTGFEHLFKWYGNGEVSVPSHHPDVSFRLTEASAAHVRELIDLTGVLVVGRKLFDQTGGWDGTHPLGKPVVVVTHSVPDGWPRADAPFTFVTDGISSAIEQASAIAGDKAVGVNGGTIARQCLELGLLDEIWVDLVPVLLGGGTPFFDQLTNIPVELEGPYEVTPATDVTHLKYRVRK